MSLLPTQHLQPCLDHLFTHMTVSRELLRAGSLDVDDLGIPTSLICFSGQWGLREQSETAGAQQLCWAIVTGAPWLQPLPLLSTAHRLLRPLHTVLSVL